MGVGFSIPTNMVGRVVEDLLEDGDIDRGWLGVSIQPLSPELASRQGEFVRLVNEWLVRKGAVQEFCLQQGIADLVRR